MTLYHINYKTRLNLHEKFGIDTDQIRKSQQIHLIIHPDDATPTDSTLVGAYTKFST